MEIKFLFFLPILLGVLMSSTNGNELNRKSIEKLENSSRWLITEATGRVYADPNYTKSLVHDLIKRFKVTLYGTPKLNNGSSILRYIPKSRGIYYDIELLKDATYDNEVYEYWVILISYKGWASKQDGKCHFIVTKSQSKTEKRTILKDEPIFFHIYRVGGHNVIDLDYEKDLSIRYKLMPWDFKKCYKDYPKMTNEKIVILNGSFYKTIPILNEAE